MNMKSRFLFSMAVVVISLMVAVLMRVEKPADRRVPEPALAAQHADSSAAVPASQPGDDAWLISPGRQVGRISKASTLADLQKAYGPHAVKATQVHVGEGETVPGAVLFEDDPQKRIEVVWKADKTAESVRLEGDKSLWHTGEGISLGTPLKTLEDLNDDDFTLAGFGWDYGGTVLSWKEGKLRKVLQAHGVILRLGPSQEAYEDKAYDQVMGDTDFSSAHPAMQKLNPRVNTLIVVFE